MAVFTVNKDRNVIPNFRNLAKTTQLGELDSVNQCSVSTTPSFHDIQSLASDWNKTPSLVIALDLMNHAILSDNKSLTEAIEAANYVFSHPGSTQRQKDFAGKLIGKDILKENHNYNISFQDFLTDENRQRIRHKIRDLKSFVIINIRNPFAYVELARLYSIVGNKKKAIRSITTAAHLAPHNRYVIRSLIRLAVHYHEEDLALFCLRQNQFLLKKDPWILASDIAVTTSLSLPATNVKKGIQLLDSWNDNRFHISELASAIATLELMNGSRKRSRGYFKLAIEIPNDNTLAQVEWANSKDSLLNIDVNYEDLNTFYEAKARDSYSAKKWQDVIELTQKWFMDQPFSKTPVLIGSDVAGSVYQDYDTASMFCKAGLISHPNDPLLLNNIAYYHALENQTEEALEYLDSISFANADQITQLCAKATRGLIHFRNKQYQQGRVLYQEAIESAYANNNEYLYFVAYLNYAREEIIVNPSQRKTFIEQVEKIPGGLSLDIDCLKASIIGNRD